MVASLQLSIFHAMKYYLLLIFLLVVFISFSQTSDFLLLKKGDRTIQTFFPGNTIDFQLDNGQWLSGSIIKIIHDSIFIEQQKNQGYLTIWGTPAYQLMNLGVLKFHINEIVALPNKEKGVSVINSGALFQVAGAAYITLNIANSIIQKDPFFAAQNLTNVGIAAGVFLFGKVLQWSHPKQITIGKKYQLQILHLTDNK